jgi:hypothetical protein
LEFAIHRLPKPDWSVLRPGPLQRLLGGVLQYDLRLNAVLFTQPALIFLAEEANQRPCDLCMANY